jgi:hypothetical protein
MFGTYSVEFSWIFAALWVHAVLEQELSGYVTPELARKSGLRGV